ncbi:MAG: DUF1641 domain-containing protein, partial [Anaerolineae bacterium]|nr:DUF1641 domain-containing protein [Anaerolineae bacterium]
EDMENLMDKDIALLHEKVDALTAYMVEQQKRQLAADELKRDMIPIANHMIKLTIDELADIGHQFQGEDLLFLGKKVLRDTHLIVKALDQLESIMGLADEANILGKQVFSNVVEKLSEFEQKGYFAFATEGMQIMDRIVTEFDQEDVQALGDNVVTILKTVRNMTQPDIMSIANNAVDALRQSPEPEEIPSPIELIRELTDPQVRKGMSRMLNLLKTLADQPVMDANNN